jgi:hypothetical protein
MQNSFLLLLLTLPEKRDVDFASVAQNRHHKKRSTALPKAKTAFHQTKASFAQFENSSE